MRKIMNKARLAGLLTGSLLVALAVSTPLIAADYPVKPINLIIGFNAGGGTDLTGRALAAELQDVMGKPVVIVNKPGAASMIAASFVSKSRADGYTLWYGSIGSMILAKELGKSELDVFSDFKQAGTVSRLVPAIAVPVNSPYQSLQDLIDDARKRPGELRWAHNGSGSAFMAAGVGFITANDLDVQAVPFSGSAKTRQALIGEQVDFGVENMNSEVNYGEKMRILGVLRQSKSDLIDPSVPAAGEEGIDFIGIDSPVGVLAPAGTSDEVMAILSDAIAEAASTEGFRAAMEKLLFPVALVPASDTTAQAESILANVNSILPTLKSE
ncbi:Bug family tripartite tricarboxylate transporter substrate binding protein [Granulosicoccus sp. 3-233]|uniref:Bug family tripartite tricarboxylate transporter substrate binding protein n=1 Tax=Granulosicoccus sp. 3-233 TaxID=3417969 RepID=UPI003D34F0F4